MQIYCKWASCRSQFMTQSDCSHSSSHSSAPQWLKTIVTCTVHSLVKRSLVISTAFFSPSFFLLSSVTQMLTTQADRFSAEEVHCSPPAHANYHHYNSFVSVGELNWKKKIQGWTSSWRPPASTSDTFSCKKTKTPEWIILKPFICTLGYGLCGDNIW